jgi:tryptophan 2,3-dioxygenase
VNGREAKMVSACAHRSLQEWLRVVAPGPGGCNTCDTSDTASEPCCQDFPYADVVAAVREDGLMELVSTVTTVLTGAATRAVERAGNPPHESWFAARWVQCATSMAGGDPSYESYTMFGTTQARTAAAIRLTSHLRRAMRSTQRLPPGDKVSALRACTQLIADAERKQPILRTILASTHLPVTMEPDEYLFLRSLQVMELLFAVAISYAAETISWSSPAELPQLLSCPRRIADTLHWSSGLFRIVVTIDVGQFARICAATAGTGALQPPAFTALERLCRGYEGLRPETLSAVPIDLVSLPHKSLQQVLALLEDHLAEEAADTLRETVQIVDREWIRWKRAHCGVARLIIGGVPGTGGTSGVAYLRRYMNIPLLTRGHKLVGRESVHVP